MLEALKLLSRSRKVLITVISIIATCLAVAFGKMTAENAAGLVSLMIPTLLASIAAEDVSKNLAAKEPAGPTTSVAVAVTPSGATDVTPAPAEPVGPETPFQPPS